MAQTTVLAASTAAGTSTDIVLASGASVSVGLFVAAGGVPGDARATVYIDTPGTDNYAFDLAGGNVRVVSGPGTFRVVKPATAVAVGVFTET